MDYDETNISTHYDRSRLLADATMKMWLDHIMAHVPPSHVSNIIDLGCGTGRFSFALAERYSAAVLGVDPSDKMLTEARRKSELKTVTFRQGDGVTLEVDDGSIDLIFLSMVFHHLDNPTQTAREAHRVLRPGGFIAVRNSTRDQLASFAHARFFPGFAALVETHLPSVATVRSTFVSAGFDEVAHDVLTQVTAPNWSECADKTALRGDSLLVRLSETAFEAGISALRAHAAQANKTQPVTENIDLLIFSKRAT